MLQSYISNSRLVTAGSVAYDRSTDPLAQWPTTCYRDTLHPLFVRTLFTFSYKPCLTSALVLFDRGVHTSQPPSYLKHTYTSKSRNSYHQPYPNKQVEDVADSTTFYPDTSVTDLTRRGRSSYEASSISFHCIDC